METELKYCTGRQTTRVRREIGIRELCKLLQDKQMGGSELEKGKSHQNDLLSQTQLQQRQLRNYLHQFSIINAENRKISFSNSCESSENNCLHTTIHIYV